MAIKAAAKGACDVHYVDEAKVTAVRRRMQSPDRVQRLCDTFQMLADPTRAGILLALAEAELCVCDLAALLQVTSAAVSQQLRLLRAMRLVKFRREGKLAYYSLDDDHVLNWIRDCLAHLEHR
ncbi:MAG: metalloregulator ArsR/SmtB family transcription factor [Armatimonadota bacterium]|jgi:ArsR family transcriptional regulator